MPKILPEYIANEAEDSDSDHGENKESSESKNKYGDGISQGSKFTMRRNEIKEKIIQEVVNKVLPDMGAFNMDEIIFGRKEEKRHWFITLLMTLGILNISCQEAILVGSYKKLSYNLVKNQMKKDPEEGFADAKDEEGRPLLVMAVQVERADMVELLLSFDAHPNIPDEEYLMTPLMHAITVSLTAASIELLKHKADPNIADKNGVTPLMMACAVSDQTHCRLLLDHLAEVDAVDCNGWSALHYCAYSGSSQCCMMLIDEGADREIADIHHRKAAHLAHYKDFGETISVLEDYKSKLNKKNR
eukprot:gene1217-2368_t